MDSEYVFQCWEFFSAMGSDTADLGTALEDGSDNEVFGFWKSPTHEDFRGIGFFILFLGKERLNFKGFTKLSLKQF